MYDIEVAWKNRKVSSFGITQGPLRWMRARYNHALHPQSVGGKLFAARCETAGKAAELLGAPRMWETPRLTYTGRTLNVTRGHVLCSNFCAALEFQVSTGLTDASVVSEQIRTRTGWLVPLDPSTITRASRCQVCGRTVYRDGSIAGKSVFGVKVPTPRRSPNSEELLAEIIDLSLTLHESRRSLSTAKLTNALEILKTV